MAIDAMPIETVLAVCAPEVHPTTATALIATESGHNPYAIGVVGTSLVRQPRSLAEAVATVRQLSQGGWNFSAGYGQINVKNWPRLGLDETSVFEPCANLRAMQQILGECYERTAQHTQNTQARVDAALSCYYSGNFLRGLKADFGGTSYVQRVRANAVRR